MLKPLASGLASLRTRLVVTYVMVTAISFLFLHQVIMRPIETALMRREENNLAWTANTLATTIRTPWRVDPDIWRQDLFWTQRRSADLAPILGARIRVLSARGQVLTDSRGSRSLEGWERQRQGYPNFARRPEVRAAMAGEYGAYPRREEGWQAGQYSIYVAFPALRRDPATDKDRLAFIVYLNRPVDAVRRDLAALRGLITLLMAASLLVTIAVSVVLSGSLSGGLSSATRVARAFAGGETGQRMREAGRDEVGELARAFNQMADALERHEQLRRDLLADVSHELRTPLTAISACADTLLDGAIREDPEAAERFLHVIARESERLQRLVSDILELSRLQAGAVEIPREPIALRPVIEDAVDIARLRAQPEGIAVTSQVPEEAPGEEILVLGNEDRLAQALRNLLDNARRHTPTGRTITVAVRADEAWVTVDVRDEGEGIPPEDLPWVFDRFYRAGRGAAAGGSGLGLAIVREIMHAHGGQVTVASAVGEGTVFSLHLPRVRAGPDSISA